jgi:4-hydroxybenzoate polyprenyltransferase
MAFNRLVDRKIDAKNPRTKMRHLPAGLVSVRAVKGFIFINATLFVLAAFWLNPLAGYLSIPTLITLCSYSYWKRFSWACHLFLGLSIGLSPVGAWVAVRGEIELFPVLLGVVLAFWVSGFDMIYATQDYKTDVEEGVNSAVVSFGIKGALHFAKVLHTLLLITMFVLSELFSLGIYWYIQMIFTGLVLLYIHLFRKSNSLDGLNQDFFWANGVISLLVFIALVTQSFIGLSL